MSAFNEIKEQLKSLRCPDCQGDGEVDDAASGDIFYNTYECPACKGTGFKTGKNVHWMIGVQEQLQVAIPLEEN